MMRNLAASLIEHEIIKTTVEKAKELRRFLEPLITKSKSDNLHSRRVVLSKLDSKEAVKKLFNDLGPRFVDVNGGYLRIIKAGFRAGDKADVCYIELTKRVEVSETTDEVLDPLEQKEEKVEDASKITQSKVTAEKPAAKEEAPKKPAAKKPAAKEEAPKKPEAKKPAAKKPAAKKPAAKEEAPKKPAAKKPAAKKDKPKENWWSRFFK
tara:strand:+ start:2479 stop:3105 length:627 start_codon:yes stop_codon:yes gene_type:complete